MADHSTESRITLHPYSRRVRILDGDTLIADTRNAIELRERSYPPRPYFQKELPQAVVDMSKISVSFPLPSLVARSRVMPLMICCPIFTVWLGSFLSVPFLQILFNFLLLWGLMQFVAFVYWLERAGT